MSAIEDARPPVLQPCPSCGLADQVAGVPAVYHAGRDSVRVTTPARFDDPEETVTRSVTTSLSSALSPEPPLRALPALGSFAAAAAGMFLVVVSIGTFIGGAAAGHWFSDRTPTSVGPHVDAYGFRSVAGPAAARPDYAFLGWISAVALLAAILLFALAARRVAARRRPQADRASAERLWEQGWFCHRCGSVHFRGEPGRPARALTLSEFRAMVWEAGGYGSTGDRGTLR